MADRQFLFNNAGSGNQQVERWIFDAATKINNLIADVRGVTGDVQFFSDGNVDDGWLLCDGSAVSRTTFADLFAFIGTDFGVGDGSTTFNLPAADTIPRGIKT